MEHEPRPIEYFDESQEVKSSPLTVRRVAGAAAIVSLCLAGYKGGAHIGDLAAQNRAHTELSSGEASGTRTLIEPIDFTCSAWSKWDVEAKYDYQLHIAKKKVPGFGGSATFEKPTTVMLQYCIKDAESYQQDTEVVKNGDKTLVKIPIDNIYLNAQIPTGNKSLDISAYSGMKTVGGGASIVSGVTGFGCSVVSLGKKKEECSKAADVIDNFKRDFDTNTGVRAEDELIESTREYASKADWEDVKNIYRDKTKAAAVKKAGGDRSAADKVDAVFVDKNGKVTNKMPEFKDIFEDLRKKGVLKNPNVDVKKTKFTANKDGTSYKPKYFDPREETTANE